MGKGTWLRAVYVITFVLSAIILHAFESACWERPIRTRRVARRPAAMLLP
jgi:hypothetical protein